MRYRCPECRTRRTDFVKLLEHVQTSKHKLCGCGGYRYVHRPGSPFCESNPLSALLMADRYGATDDDLQRIRDYLTIEHPHLAAKIVHLLAQS